MRRSVLQATASVLCAALMIVLVSCQKQKATTQAQPTSVHVVAAARRQIDVSVEYAARITPAKTVTITPKVSGRVAMVRVDVGDAVKKGDTLLTLDSTDYAAQLRQAQAALSGAQASLARTNDSSIGQQVLEAQSAVQQAQVQLDNTKSDYDKTSKLFSSGVVSKQQFDAMTAKYKSAQIQLQTAKDNLTLIQKKSGPQSSGVVSAQVDQAKAQVDLAKSQLDATTITAPTDGVVAVRDAEVGEMLGTSSLAFVIIDAASVVAEAGVSERVVGRISDGDQAEVSVDAVGPQTITGSVETVSPAVDERGLYLVKVRIPNPDGAIKPGMLARLRFTVEKHADALAVPNSAVVTEAGLDYLYVVQSGVVHKRQVQIGASDAEYTEISSGLADQDEVVVDGQSFLSDGDQVKPTT